MIQLILAAQVKQLIKRTKVHFQIAMAQTTQRKLIAKRQRNSQSAQAMQLHNQDLAKVLKLAESFPNATAAMVIQM